MAYKKMPESQTAASRQFERELLKETDKKLKQFTKQINDAQTNIRNALQKSLVCDNHN